VPNITYMSLLSVSQQQLRNIAMDTLKTMLLDAGYPYNWGSLPNFSNSSLQRFGLGLYGSNSFYVLDPNKVSRLILDNPTGHLGYDTVRDRLKLQGYGFNFRIIAPFNVTINGGQPVYVETLRSGVLVTVKYNSGGPICNADVKARILYIKNNRQFNWSTPPSTRTDVLGQCTIRAGSDFQDVEDFVAIFYVTVADLTSVNAIYNAGFTQRAAQASIIGANVTLWVPPVGSTETQSRRVIQTVHAITETDYILLFPRGDEDPNAGKFNAGTGYETWSYLFPELLYEDVLFLVFNIRLSLPGDTLVLFLAPRPNWLGARVEAYGDVTGTRGASTAVKVQRNVVISGMTYIAELTMWKEST